MLEKTKQELLTKINSHCQPVVGIGVTAFNRIAPAFFLRDYEIICYKDSADIGAMKACGWKVKTIQSDFPDQDLYKLNSLEILKHQGVAEYLKQKKAKIFVYRTSTKIDLLAGKLGLELLANSEKIRGDYENKKKFRQIGARIGLPMIPGVSLQLDSLTKEKWFSLRRQLGERLVFQVIEYERGGGKGTFFINGQIDWQDFWQAVAKEKEKKLKNVNVTRFIQGASPSITGCVTRHGILTGVVQTQVLDQPELKPSDRSGVFCGHDWSFCRYPSSIQKQAEAIANRLGSYMQKHGYKGIFGLDLVIDSQNQKVYPVECNPRYTGAFPVYSMLQAYSGEIPLDIFQLLEFLNIDYQIDIKKVNASWKTPKSGAHLVLSNPYGAVWSRVFGNLPAGVYRFNGKLNFIRPGISFAELKDENEFIYTDGVPRRGDIIKPGLRCGKLVFSGKVLDETRRLLPPIKKIVKAIYQGLDIKKITREPQWNPTSKNWIFS